MIRTALDMRVREGCTDAFERTWRDAAEVASRYPGSIGQTMLRGAEDPLRYTITADWETAEHLARYQRSEDRQALSAALDQLRDSATKTLFEVVAHIPSPSPSETSPTEKGTAPR
ncbi:antibiotic biosynthesis monooxygenase family protein [Streptomyces sp. NPDC000851]